MKYTFVGIVAALSMLTANADNTDWSLNEVISKDNSIAGYVYETIAVGTQSGSRPEKNISSIQLVCTVLVPDSNNLPEPLLMLTWNTLEGNSPQLVDLIVDNGSAYTLKFEHDGSLLYRPLSESTQLLHSIITSKNVKVSWTDETGTRRIVIFNLRNINAQLNVFSDKCGVKL